jgi:hypothetical protein
VAGAGEGAGGVERPREAEVGHVGPALAAQQDVARLEVAVDHAGAVGGVDGPRDLGKDGSGLPRRERRRGKRGALDVGHRQEAAAVVGLAELEDGGDVRMMELRGEAGLALEAGGVGGEGQAVEELEGGPAREAPVPGLPDDAHAAAAHRLDEHVLAREAPGIGGVGRHVRRQVLDGRGGGRRHHLAEQPGARRVIRGLAAVGAAAYRHAGGL